MRSPNTVVISVRKANKSIKTKEKFYHALAQKYKIFNIPILRGVINLFEMMIIGFNAINFSANEYADDQIDSPKKESDKKTSIEKIVEIFAAIISIVLAIGISILLFKFIPLWITTFLESKFAFIKSNYIIFNLIDGVLKTTIFILYIYIMTLIPSFKRIFEYHGAEHKSVFTYEKSLPLTVENAKKQSRFHPRCGTSFILIVFVISIIIYTVVPKQDTFIHNFAVRIAFLPLIAGVSYEYLKLSARYAKNRLSRIFIAPGLWLQRLTTREPSNDQLEVALDALKKALKKESTYSPQQE